MKNPTVKVGDIFVDINGLKCEVVEYISSQKVKVVFEDGYTQFRTASVLRKSFIKGTRTDRRSKPKEQSAINFILRTKHYSIKRRLFLNTDDIKNASYSSSTISEDWLNFSSFKSWALTQIGHDKSDWHIDKDILCKGSTHYSPETCCFVPLRINILFTSRAAKRGDYPIGVYKDKKSGKYVAQCRDGVGRARLGRFENPEQAFYAYKIFKENLIKSVAQEYKDAIAPNVYEALINYRVEITD